VGRLRSDLADLGVVWSRPGDTSVPGRRLWRVERLVVGVVVVTTNLVGAAVVVLIAAEVEPLPAVADAAHLKVVNLIVAAAYVAGAVVVGYLAGARRLLGLRRWLLEERPAWPDEQLAVLRAPLRLFVVQMGLWTGAALLFGLLNGVASAALGAQVAVTVVLTGVSTAACAYLLTERLLRSAAARALADGAPERLAGPGVALRAVLAWALGSGVPVAGLVVIGVVALTRGEATRSELAVSMVVLGAVALVVGLLAVGVATRATADPVDSVRRALGLVRAGRFDTQVPVYDATQLGQLQLGFNRMAGGLAERERIRDAFGTYVDPDVAERILAEGTRLAGEEVEVTVMFLDIRDFTGFAERRDAREVVAAVNALFEVVVPIVHAHGGRVDKYIGDGLLAVFGAPRRLSDHADRALAAALEVARAVAGGALAVGIGLNSGTVLAGTVGGAGRFEFSVIGDVVNTAARVEATTRRTGDTVLLTGLTRDRLGPGHPPLVERAETAVRGRRQPVRLYAPGPAPG
jgi:adenylate cyclase